MRLGKFLLLPEVLIPLGIHSFKHLHYKGGVTRIDCTFPCSPSLVLEQTHKKKIKHIHAKYTVF